MALKLTEAEKATLPHSLCVIAEINEAEERGDLEKILELNKQLTPPAKALLAAKLSMGADWVRTQGWNLKQAEEKYGKDWLERDIHPTAG